MGHCGEARAGPRGVLLEDQGDVLLQQLRFLGSGPVRGLEISVQRFWDDEAVRHGSLVHRAGGNGGSTWTLPYADRNPEEEGRFRLGDHVAKPDEFVSIRDAGGIMQTFRVTGVRPAGEALR